MGITLEQVAAAVDGVVDGDPAIEITGLAGLSEAEAGDLSFLSRPKYAKAVESTKASAVIVSKDWEGTAPCALVRVDNPDKAFMLAAQVLMPAEPPRKPGVDATSSVASSAQIDESAHIGPLCVVEDGVTIGPGTVLIAGCYIGRGSVLGEGCLIYPNVSIREGVTMGDRVIIHCGAVIGSDGFGYVKEGQVWRKIPQLGAVELGDDVEIGANASIDRARFGKTVIENGAKIDNLVQIAHNVRIGANTAIAAHVGVAGSTSVGSGVQIGGQAGVAGHVTVGDYSVVAAQAGVTKDVPGKTFVSGYPAIPHRQAMKVQANTMRLPELRARVAELEKKIEALEESTEGGSE